jgi:hypothetical protein
MTTSFGKPVDGIPRRDFLRLSALASMTPFFCRLAPATSGPGRIAIRASRGTPGSVRVLSGHVSLHSLTVDAGSTVQFDPNRTTTVELSGNAILYGLLQMRPARPEVIHTLRFVGVDESKFVGGGTVPLDTDVGLWVMGGGELDLMGTPRQAWNRTGTSPTWLAGDEIVVAPTAIGDYTGFEPFTPGSPVPQVEGMPAAEVMNLTRNVRIEGTPGGRSHVFILSSVPQSIRNAAIRHMGPRQGNAPVLGRYGCHFHMCGDGSRGSIVKNVVVRDAGSHAFVPHMSNGIQFKSCISYNTQEDAYWYDYKTSSDDLLFKGCVAALVLSGEEVYRLAGFVMGPSMTQKSNRCLGCVAVGVQGDVNASGFLWDEDNEGVWVHQDCVGHNNVKDGIFTWQNTQIDHLVERFTGYRNGKNGIEHGAYVNNYTYSDALLKENAEAGFYVHSQSGNPAYGYPDPQRFIRPVIVGNGVTQYGFVLGLAPGTIPPPPGKDTAPSIATGPNITGCTVADYYQPNGLPISSVLTITP